MDNNTRINELKALMSDRKKFTLIAFLITVAALFVFYAVTRLYHLDADLPPWGIAMYQPMDEGQYATMALTKYNFKSFTMAGYEQFYMGEHVRINVVENIIIYILMRILGDNYYGFRMASVLAGAAVTAFFTIVLFVRDKENRVHPVVKALFALLLCCNFAFLMSNRVIEPSIFRMLAVQFIVLIFAIDLKQEWYKHFQFLAFGFVAVFSIFGIYITNIFLMLTFLILAGFEIKKTKEGWIWFFEFVFGAVIAFFLCEFYYYLVWGTSCLSNTLSSIMSFSYDAAYTGWTNYIYAIFQYFSSNSLLYNLTILFLFFFCFIPQLKNAWRRHDTFLMLNCLLVICFLLQTFISNDYIIRKGIIVYPQILYIVYDYFYLQDRDETEMKLPKLTAYGIAAGVLTAFFCLYRLRLIRDDIKLDFARFDKYLILSQLLVVGICFAIIFLLKNRKMIRKYLTIALFLSLYTSAFFSVKYVFTNNTFSEKQAMIDLGGYAGDDIVYGIYSIGFTLYNDIRPMVNSYEELGNIIREENKAVWYLDYELNEELFSKQTLMNFLKINELEHIATFNRDFSTFGRKRGVSLYQYSTGPYHVKY